MKIAIYFNGILILFFLAFLPNFGHCDPSIDDVKNQGNLIFAHVIFRHGARTPIDLYPNDPWKNVSDWPVDWGQLTNFGKQQHYQLGKWLRNRYQHLLNDEYSTKLIYIQSTDVDRTIMSALSNIAGMFPPDSNQTWNSDLKWQPIPVHTCPEKMDYVLAGKKHCAAYDFALKKYKNSEEYKKLVKHFKPLFKYLTEMSGMKVDSFTSVNNLYSTLFIEQFNNKTLPEWTKKVYYPGSDMQWIAARSFATKTFTPQLARLKAGFLLKEILQRFKNKTESVLKPDRSMWVYSGHDTTIGNILNTLGVFEYHSPPFAACIMLELRILNKIPMIQVFYKNTTGEPQLMNIPNCGTSCPLDQMFKLYADILPEDFETECRLSMLSMTYAEVEIGSATAPIITGIVLLSIAMSIFVTLYFYQRRNYPDAKWYMRIDG